MRDDDAIDVELRARVRRPQRHRLLQGYPMAPLMRPVSELPRSRWVGLDPARPLLVGVLPHAACNPKVRGCGFCTFPHEKFDRAAVEACVARVAAEIGGLARTVPSLRERRIGAVYFGGGTANLTPPDAFAGLYDTLTSHLGLGDAEITLEGVPRYFAIRGGALLDVLGRSAGRHKRISMGVQTLDPDWLARMGRDAFGDAAEIRELVEDAHRRGFTASADMLVNLPGRSVAEELRDIEACIGLGVDQVCAYNLVLSPSHDAPWAKDRAMLSRVPGPDSARTTWLAVRQLLIDSGFVQTTLTNFERKAIVDGPRAFFYERASFDAATWDAIGFGPAAISTFTDRGRRRAIKWSNEGASARYAEGIDARGEAVASSFRYTPTDLRLLHLTRGFAKLSVRRDEYRTFFGTDPREDFGAELGALERAGLVRVDDAAIVLTPEGAFHADAVVGLLAASRVTSLRHEDRGASTAGHMG